MPDDSLNIGTPLDLSAHQALADCVRDLRIRFADIVDEWSLDIVFDFFTSGIEDCADLDEHLEHLRIVVRDWLRSTPTDSPCSTTPAKNAWSTRSSS